MKPKGRTIAQIGLAGTVIAGLCIVAIVSAFVWVSGERDRALQAWQSRLMILAATRAGAIEDWFATQKSTISELADSAALRLYISEIQTLPEGADRREILAEREYVETLLKVTARQNGFDQPPLGDDIPAGIERKALAGMAIVDRDAKIIAATAALPALKDNIRALISETFQSARVGSSSLYSGDSIDATFLALAGPIHAIQDETVIAAIIGIKAVDEELFPLLRQPGELYDSAETMLVAREGNAIRYVSPLADETGAMQKVMSFDTPGLASAFAIRSPRDFAIRNDYRGEEVLVVGWPVPGTDWTLVYKVSRAEAMGETETRLLRTLLLILAGIVLAALGAVALWRNGASVRAAAASRQYQLAAEALERQARFTQTLSDAEPNVTFVVDDNERIIFANRKAAEEADTDSQEALIGKSLDRAFGPHAARAYRENLRKVHLSGEPVAAILEREYSETNDARISVRPRTLRMYFVPLRQGEDAGPASTLIVQEDLTSIVEAEHRSQSIQASLVDSLVGLIDNRNIMTVNHAGRTKKIAQAIALAIGLDSSWIKAVEEAARLLNIGRVFIPNDLLLQKQELAESDVAEIRAAMAQGVEFLSGIDFERPVGRIVTIALQLRNRDSLSGAGPESGEPETEDLCGRIVAAADAIVAMTSAREYRDALDPKSAFDELARSKDIYGADIIFALAHVLENMGGNKLLTEIQSDTD